MVSNWLSPRRLWSKARKITVIVKSHCPDFACICTFNSSSDAQSSSSGKTPNKNECFNFYGATVFCPLLLPGCRLGAGAGRGGKIKERKERKRKGL